MADVQPSHCRAGDFPRESQEPPQMNFWKALNALAFPWVTPPHHNESKKEVLVFPNHSFPKCTKTQIAHEIVVSHLRTCANKQQKNLRLKKKKNMEGLGAGLKAFLEVFARNSINSRWSWWCLCPSSTFSSAGKRLQRHYITLWKQYPTLVSQLLCARQLFTHLIIPTTL